MIDELQVEASALLASGDYTRALAEFSVLREIRSRRDGPYSLMYLSNLHDAVRCMCHLQLWADSEPLGRELYGKYRRTHGPGGADTVDAAKLYAWALVHLHKIDPAVAIYLTTADALWTRGATDEATALLGAAVVHRQQLCFDDCRNAAALAATAATVCTCLPVATDAVTIDGLRVHSWDTANPPPF
ncbi:hypothetical protein [Williamsia sp. CHRR-6]|uniref:hypothetical protein n=1 Tax=Williamsia sp. CHRR-6 TaxID=2835871 RepID=UPI001BD9284F|nr:hypothetical protein [Williamsia sp. CHRR-6]MBT0567440.1 hypothetical protein [Williamsia sp. CHRR-6]